MRQARFGFIIFLFLISELVNLSPAHGQADDVDTIRERVEALVKAGKYQDARPAAEQMVGLARAKLGERHPATATSLILLAEVLSGLGKLEEAATHEKVAIEIRTVTLGAEHPDTAKAIRALAGSYRQLGRYVEAEPLAKGALAILEKTLGPDHLDVATSLNNLARLYDAQGRYAEAEPLHKRALGIREKALGPDHLDVGRSLNNLATLYYKQGLYADAELPFKRTIAIFETALAVDHADVGAASSNLATLYDAQGRYAEAEPLHKRALGIREAQGPDHPGVAYSLSNLAMHYQSQGRYAEADRLMERALSIFEKALGPNHPNVATTLGNLAWQYQAQGRYAEAEPLYERALGIREKVLGPDHPDVGVALGNLASLLISLGRLSEAETLRRRELRIMEKALGPDHPDVATSLNNLAQLYSAQGHWADVEPLYKRALAIYQNKLGPDHPQIAAQLHKLASLHFIKSDWKTAAMYWEQSTELLIRRSQRGAETVGKPLINKGSSEAQRASYQFSYLIKATYRLMETDGEQIPDETQWNVVESAPSCEAALKATPRKETVKIADKDVPVQVLPFDAARAHTLYKALLGPFEDMIKGKHLLVVPSGPLTSLPFHVLVTEAPKTAIPVTLPDYRGVAWLGMRQPITVLPSVTSLKSLRQVAKTSRATKPYLGVGNPLLDGPDATHDKRAQLARAKQTCPNTRSQPIGLAAGRPQTSFAKLFRGANADIDKLRQAEPLPETADELCEVGLRLGVAKSEILLGSRATEAALKDLSETGSLANYAILHFATHGALTGEVKGVAEPGLILTPPAKGTSDPKALERDDGFLSASEIATFKLDADWVILSACNTAGPNGETAEAMSGMARAFFYAGARALLVSHWEVGSDAAVKLTTRAFAELKSNPRIGRAEAFRISMRELVEKGLAHEAHPSQWAPFVVVGEGGGEPSEAAPVTTSTTAPPSPPAFPARPKRPKQGSQAPDWRTDIWR